MIPGVARPKIPRPRIALRKAVDPTTGGAKAPGGGRGPSATVPPAAPTTPPATAPPGAPPPPRGNQQRFNPYKALAALKTGAPLTGKQLNQAARALTALEVRPQVHGYKDIINQLTTEKNTTAAGLSSLGERLQGNVSSTYRSLAQSEAENVAHQQALAGQLNTNSAAISKQGTDALAQMQTGELGDLQKGMALRGAPGGGEAQAALAAQIASQQGRQVANNEAAQNFANTQGGSYAGLSAGEAGAAQLQGGTTVGNIGRDTLSRVSASNQKYGESIQTALQKLGDAKALKGATMVKNLTDLRAGEQKFLLGKRAVQNTAQANANTAAHNAATTAVAQQNANSSAVSAAASAKNAQTNASQPSSAQNTAQANHQKVMGYVKDIRSTIQTGIATADPKNPPSKQEIIAYVNSKTSAPPHLVTHVVNHYWQTHNVHIPTPSI